MGLRAGLAEGERRQGRGRLQCQMQGLRPEAGTEGVTEIVAVTGTGFESGD